MKILFVTHGLPFGPHGGAKMRNLELIRGVSGEHEVHLIATTWEAELKYLALNRREFASFTFVVSMGGRAQKIRAALRGVLKGRPLAIAQFYSEETEEKIRSFLLHNEVDLIVLEESLVAPYMDAIPRNCRARVVIDFHNVASHQAHTMTRMHLIGRRVRVARVLDWFLAHNWEGRYANRADQCLVVSDQEGSRLRKAAPRARISVVANGIHPGTLLGQSKASNTLVFVGTMAYQPNADAMRFFCRSILARIRMQIPDIRLYIVGLDPPPDICGLGVAEKPEKVALASSLGRIVVTGEVRDTRPYYEVANIVIVPLRAGGGTRLKILEAMALGRPVVSTSFGCEGLAVKDGEHLMIADQPREFAEKVIELLENPQLAQRLCRNARSLVETRYDWMLLRKHFSCICGEKEKETMGASDAILEGVEA